MLSKEINKKEQVTLTPPYGTQTYITFLCHTDVIILI